MAELCAMIDGAMELWVQFDKAEDEDLKHEFGFQYSELIVEIGDMMEEMNSNGINLYLH